MPPHLIFTTRCVLLGSMLLATQLSYAQADLDGSLLGLNESTLQTIFPALQRVPRPARGPRGLLGQWKLPATTMSSLPFATTFYMKDKHVQRIEQRWSAPRDCKTSTFVTLQTDMTAKYGPGLTSHAAAGKDMQQRSAVWETGTFDATAHLTQSPAQCAILVVYRAHIEKDASEL